MKNGKIFLYVILLLLNIVSVISFIPKTYGRSITVDGDPSDWLADTSLQDINTGKYYSDVGEYVWKDSENDDIGDGDYTYPLNATYFGTANNTADLLEFRITYDSENVYFLIKLVNVSNAFGKSEGFSVPIVTIHIDQDRVDASGQEWTAQYMDAKLDSSCWWEYAIVVKGGGSYVLDKNFNNLGTITVKGSEEYDVIEVSVPQSKIGSPINEIWRFMVYVGLEEYENFREIDEVASEWHGGGGAPSGTNEWVECDAYDAAFYTNGSIQSLDWSDYNATTGTPTLLCNIRGEGYVDIDFSQLPLKNPHASFEASPVIAKVGETISFDASASEDPDGYIVEYEWNFGDGTVTFGTDPYITHSYLEPGVYKVTLTVTDNDGLSGSTSHMIVVIERVLLDSTNDFVLRPYQDLREFYASSNGTHLILNVTVDQRIPDGGWNYLNMYIAIHTTSGGNVWFPEYIDAKYPDGYEYAWEYCLVIHNLTDISLLDVSYAPIRSYNGSLSEDNCTVSVVLPLSDIGNPGNVTLGVVTSEDNGRCKDTVGIGTVGTADWGQWVEVSAAITDLLTTAGSSAVSSDIKPRGVGLGKAFYDFTEAAYGLNSTHLVVAGVFDDVTGLDNSWVWPANWRMSIAVDIDHIEGSGQPYIAFMGGDIRINPDFNVTYWEYCILVDSPSETDIHLYNSTWFDFGANGTKAYFIEEGKAVVVVIPKSSLPGLTEPMLTIVSGEDAGNTLYDLIGTYSYSYAESPQGVYLVAPPVAGHDVAVVTVTPLKTIVGVGYSCQINVTVINEGEFIETFTVTVYANTTAVGNLTVDNLAGGSLVTLTFIWDTAGFAKGNYTISAYAWPVSGEVDVADNTFVDGWVYVGVSGDVDANGLVNMLDLYNIALHYGSLPGDPDYIANYDINSDDIINMLDLYIAAIHFGETDP